MKGASDTESRLRAMRNDQTLYMGYRGRYSVDKYNPNRYVVWDTREDEDYNGPDIPVYDGNAEGAARFLDMTKAKRNGLFLDALGAAANTGVALSTGASLYDRFKGKAKEVGAAAYDRREDEAVDVAANGSDRLIPYVIYIDGRSMGEWRTRERYGMPGHGQPNDDNLERWVMGYAKSLELGGVNEHISKSLGYIPYPKSAYVKAQTGARAGDIVATWEAAPFQVFSKNGKRNPFTGAINIPSEISARLGDEHINDILNTENPIDTLSVLRDKAETEGDYWGANDYTSLIHLLIYAGVQVPEYLQSEQNPRRFEDISIGEWFSFEGSNKQYQKTGARTYFDPDLKTQQEKYAQIYKLKDTAKARRERGQIRVGSINAKVNPQFTVSVDAPAIRESVDVRAFTVGGAMSKGKRKLRGATKIKPKWTVEKNPRDPYGSDNYNGFPYHSVPSYAGDPYAWVTDEHIERLRRQIVESGGRLSVPLNGDSHLKAKVDYPFIQVYHKHGDDFVTLEFPSTPSAEDYGGMMQENPRHKRKGVVVATLINPESDWLTVHEAIADFMDGKRGNVAGFPGTFKKGYVLRGKSEIMFAPDKTEAYYAERRSMGDDWDFSMTDSENLYEYAQKAGFDFAPYTRENPQHGISGKSSRIAKLASSRAKLEARLRRGDQSAAQELARVNAQIAREQERRAGGRRNPEVNATKVFNTLQYATSPEDFKTTAETLGVDILSVYPFETVSGVNAANFTVQFTDTDNITRVWQFGDYGPRSSPRYTRTQELEARGNGRGKLSASVKSRLNSLSKMFHGEKNKHAGKVRSVPISGKAKAAHYTRNGSLPWVKLLSDATGAHAPTNHACTSCAIQFNPSTSFVGMTTGKRLQIMGNGVHARGKTLRHNLIAANPELANYDAVDLGPVDVLWYETPEKHAGQENAPLVHYYHNHGEDSGRVEDKPHLLLDSDGMLYLDGGNYTVTELGIEN